MGGYWFLVLDSCISLAVINLSSKNLEVYISGNFIRMYIFYRSMEVVTVINYELKCTIKTCLFVGLLYNPSPLFIEGTSFQTSTNTMLFDTLGGEH